MRRLLLTLAAVLPLSALTSAVACAQGAPREAHNEAAARCWSFAVPALRNACIRVLGAALRNDSTALLAEVSPAGVRVRGVTLPRRAFARLLARHGGPAGLLQIVHDAPLPSPLAVSLRDEARPVAFWMYRWLGCAPTRALVLRATSAGHWTVAEVRVVHPSCG